MSIARTETFPWDPADYIDSPEAARAYLEAAFEDGTPELISAAIGDVVRARGATAIAREADISREAIYKAFSKDGNPTLTTIMGVMKALGLTLSVKATV